MALLLDVDCRSQRRPVCRPAVNDCRAKENKATIHPMLNLPITPFPRRVAASFNQALEPWGIRIPILSGGGAWFGAAPDP
jgi:hypothetical protein